MRINPSQAFMPNRDRPATGGAASTSFESLLSPAETQLGVGAKPPVPSRQANGHQGRHDKVQASDPESRGAQPYPGQALEQPSPVLTDSGSVASMTGATIAPARLPQPQSLTTFASPADVVQVAAQRGGEPAPVLPGGGAPALGQHAGVGEGGRASQLNTTPNSSGSLRNVEGTTASVPERDAIRSMLAGQPKPVSPHLPLPPEAAPMRPTPALDTPMASAQKDLAQVQSSRAFGLDELGMFGVHGALPPGSLSSRSPGVSGPSNANPADLAFPTPMAQPLGVPAETVLPTAVDQVVDLPAAPTARVVGGAGIFTQDAGIQLTATSIDAPDAREAGIGVETQQNAEEHPASARSEGFGHERSSEAKDEATLSLIVNDTNGLLQIVAAAPTLDLAALARLRGRMDDTANEYGRRVQLVTLNGEAIERDSSAPQGHQS